MTNYELTHIKQFYSWLDHTKSTELNAFHIDYRPGRENLSWNTEHDAFTKIDYAEGAASVEKFVQKYHQKHMVCIGHNQRPQAFRNDNETSLRSAKNTEIKEYRNVFVDIDFESKNASKAQLAALDGAIKTEFWNLYGDQGYVLPEYSITGGGAHLYSALVSVSMKDVPDVSQRVAKFVDELRYDLKPHLSRLEMKIDSTHDPRRVVRLPGTQKPEIGYVSSWSGGTRRKDAELTNYLITMDMSQKEFPANSLKPQFGGEIVRVADELPQMFKTMYRQDKRLQELWDGIGKPTNSDLSRSGYDFSVMRRLIVNGVRDVDDLATILANRPDGAVRNSGKGEDYIRRTIANALAR